MKKKSIVLALGLIAALTVVKSNAVHTDVSAKAEDAAVREQAPGEVTETEVFGEVIKAENGEIVLAVGSIDYANGMTFKADGREICFAVTEKTVIKSTAGTEGETASADDIRAGLVAAVSLSAERDEALALTIIHSAVVEEETEEEPEELSEAQTESLEDGGGHESVKSSFSDKNS